MAHWESDGSSGGAMSLAITSQIVDEVVILDLSGRMSVLESTLPAQVKTFLEQGQRSFIVNLDAVSYVDSSGLGQLVTIWISIRNKSGQLILIHPTARVRELFHISKLDTVFHIVDDKAEAVRRLQNA